MGSNQDVLTVPDAVCDPQRLAAVLVTGLLDTGSEDHFDRLACLAAMLLDAPVRQSATALAAEFDAAVVPLSDGQPDGDIALLVLRVREDDVPSEQG